uniref:UDENN domain-containing protein n=1 Tax=Tetradesmus obliquus TaxID=3088 RepID=A0A383W295_TETOB
MNLAPLKTHVEPGSSSVGPAAGTWIIGICSVVFDIDVGQTLQHLHPENCLSEEEQSSVAFHAFPDSLSMELYTRNAIRDSSFQFRIKRIPASFTGGAPDFLYGYVFCRQRQDESLRRGGEQAAVVVLASVPLSSMLMPLSLVAGHAFFSEGEAALEQLVSQVAVWPPPVPGSRVSLPAGHAMISGQLPHFTLLPPPQPEVHPSVQATLARRAQRAASIRRGGAIAIAAGSASQLAHAGSNGSSIDTAASTAEQQQQQPLQQQGSTELAAGAAGMERSESAAEAAAAVAASWMSIRTGDSCPESPGAGASDWSFVGGAESAAAAAAATSPAARVQSGISRLQQPGSSSGSPGPLSLSRSSGSISSRSSPALLAVAAADGSSSSEWPAWITTTLGQQWQQETPFPEVDAAVVLQPLLRHAWTLWQLLITAQPLMVVGLTPRDTSAAVAALMGLIAPLPYAADYRPYFTIHDPDFVALSRGKLPQFGAYQEQLPAAAQDVTTPAGSTGTEQKQQQEQQQQSEHQAGTSTQQQQELTNTTCDPTAASQQGPQQPLQLRQAQQEQQQDPQQQQQQQQADNGLPVLIGITNLYFIKMLPQWPNVVSVSKKEAVSRPASMGGINGSSGGNQQPEQRASSSRSLAAAAGSNTPDDSSSDQPAGSTTDSAAAPAAAAPRRAGLISSTAAAALRAYRRHQQGPQHLLSDFSPHLWSSCKPLIRPDASLIASVTAALENEQQAAAGAIAGGLAGGPGGGLARSRSGVPAGAAGRQLRRHFGELTAAFLAPFQRYFEPGANGMVPRWCPQHFLASLKSAGLPPALAARLAGNAFASAAALYAAFIAGPNFAHWFGQQRRPVLHLVEPAAPEQDEVAEEGYDVLPDVQRQQQQQPADTAASSGSGSNSAGSSGSGGTSGSGSGNSADDEVARVQAFLGAEQDMLSVGEQQQQCELQARLVRTFTALPRDLQLALISSPARRHLLDDVVAALQAGNNNSNGSSAATVGAGDKQHVAFGRGVDVLEGLQQLQQLMQELSVGSS